MLVSVVGGSEPAFHIKSSKVRMSGVEILCNGHAPHGIVNSSGWDNELTVLRDITIRQSTSHAILHEDGDAVMLDNFFPFYCNGFGFYSQNNLLNSRLHFAKTNETGGVLLTKRDQQPEGVDIGGKIIPYTNRSGVVIEHGLKITIMPDSIIDQCGLYALDIHPPVSDVTVCPGTYLGGMNGPSHQNPPGNPNAPLVTLRGGNMIRLDGVTIQGGASDQLIAFPGVRLLDIVGCSFQNSAPGRANCNISGMQHSKLMQNRFWHARSGGGSVVWSGGDASCCAYDNTSFHGNDATHGGAWGNNMIITGATRQRDNVEVTLPNGWTH